MAVVYRGRWTAGSGPDFQDAMLNLGGEGQSLTKGCVEIHLRCADWYTHGHDKDPRYNEVALHVVLWPVGAKPVLRADGVKIPTLVLADYISVPAHELLDTVSPLVCNLGTLSEEPCWERTQNWPLETLLKQIEDAGDERLMAKAAVMESDLDVYGSTSEVLSHGIMDSLGYSANREPMRALAAALPIGPILSLPLSRDKGERSLLLESLFLGASEFLPSQRPDLGKLDYVTEAYAQEVEEIWEAHAPLLGLNPARAIGGWRTDRVRPANAPGREFAAAARLLADLLWEPGGMLGPFLASAEHLSPRANAQGVERQANRPR